MRKALKISGIIVAALAALILLAFASLPLLLNSRIVTDLVDRYAAEYIDGELEYSGLHISLYRDFPLVEITLENAALTYPHERFSQYDLAPAPNRLLDAGRGVSRDTLARFRTFSAAADVQKLLRGEISIHKIALSGFAAYAHDYGDAANWNMFRLPESEPDSSAFELPWVQLRELRIDGSPQLVYTAQSRDVYAAMRFRSLDLSGRARLSADQIHLHDLHLAADSLRLFGQIPQDTLSVRLDRLRLDEPKPMEFDLSLSAEALVRTAALGRIDLPLRLDGRVGIGWSPEQIDIDLPRLDARVAQLPLHAEGSFSLCPDRIGMDLSAQITDCPIDSLQRLYLDRYLELSRDIKTNARLTLTAEASGTYSAKSLPAVKICASIPQSHTYYRAMDLGADLLVDIDASISPSRRVDARIHKFKARIPGLDLHLDGSASDLLGRNPHYVLSACADAEAEPLMRFVPASIGVGEAVGSAHLDFEARVTQEELRTYQFRKADISGSLTSDSLHIVMPADSIDATLFSSRMQLGSNEAGLRINADFDSVYVSKGEQMQARIREMRNGAQIVKVESQGQLVPRLFASSDNGPIFVRLGANRVGLRDANIWLAAEKRVRRSMQRRRAELDSLQARNPDVPRADLAARMMQQEPRRQPRGGAGLADSDLSIALDTTWSRMLRDWTPSGSIESSGGFIATPRMPLRTRLTAVSAEFDDNEFSIDSVGIVSGTSDLRASGYVQGLRRALFRRGVIDAQLNLESRRLNINELVAALQAGNPDPDAADPADEQDESFVTDTLQDARIDRDRIPLVLVPGNIRATLGVQADTVDYAELQVGPVLAVARFQDRTAQLLGTHIVSDMGRIGMDAYYSTRNRQEISAGVNLLLQDMKAHDIIQLLPSVDSLMPVIKSFEGLLGCQLSATAQIDTNMNVVIPSVDGLLRISGKNLEVKEAGELKRITRLLLFRNKDIGHISDLHVDAVVHDSKIEVFPFELGVDRYRLALLGMQGFDKSMYYHISVLSSPLPIRFGINVFGSLDNWKFSVGRARWRDGGVPVYTQQLDSVQVNIARGIRDIFNTGVQRVRDYNAARPQFDFAQDAGQLSQEESEQVHDLVLAAELEEQDAALSKAVDDAIAAATKETDEMMKVYAEQIYDKKILRKMERLNKKQ